MKLITAVATALLVVACSAARPGTTTNPSTVPAQPSTTAVPNSPAADAPPSGILSVAGNEVNGLLGTYCWTVTCVDMFETPPAAGLPLAQAVAGEALNFSLGRQAGFSGWSASYRADDADELTLLGEGGSDVDPDSSSSPPPPLMQADFDAPPAGDWVLIVQTFFDEGDAQYLWHVVAD